MTLELTYPIVCPRTHLLSTPLYSANGVVVCAAYGSEVDCRVEHRRRLNDTQDTAADVVWVPGLDQLCPLLSMVGQARYYYFYDRHNRSIDRKASAFKTYLQLIQWTI